MNRFFLHHAVPNHEDCTPMALDGALRYRHRLLLGCPSELVGFVQDSHLCQSDVLNSPEATPLSTSASSNRNRLHTNETSPNDDLKTWLNIGFWPYYGSRMFGLREGPLLLTPFPLQPPMIFHLIFRVNFFFLYLIFSDSLVFRMFKYSKIFIKQCSPVRSTLWNIKLRFLPACK